jgi:hypothetical protein
MPKNTLILHAILAVVASVLLISVTIMVLSRWTGVHREDWSPTMDFARSDHGAGDDFEVLHRYLVNRGLAAEGFTVELGCPSLRIDPRDLAESRAAAEAIIRSKSLTVRIARDFRHPAYDVWQRGRLLRTDDYTCRS